MRKHRYLSLLAAFMLSCSVGIALAPEAAAKPSCPIGTTAQDGICTPCDNALSCYQGPSEMRALVDQVVPWFTAFSKATYDDMPRPTKWWVVRAGETATSKCGKQPSAKAFDYCAPENSPYYGADALWQLASKHGDAVAAIGMAHVYAHHIQHRAKADMTPSAMLENQAYCFTGAWTTYAVNEGKIGYDSTTKVGNAMALIAAFEGNPKLTLNNVMEQIVAFELGRNQGVKACGIFPGLPPLLTPAPNK